MAEQCGTCRYSDPVIITYAEGDVMPEGDQPALACKRYPPATVEIDGSVAHTWPTVADGDWCGEYRAAE